MVDDLLNMNNKEENQSEILKTPIEQVSNVEQINTKKEVADTTSKIKEKSILFLINGLGVASKESFNINYQDIMPNMTMLMNNYLYTTLQNINYNYKNGFRNFSLGNDLLPTYNLLENDTNLASNQTIINMSNDTIKNNTKLHLFCFLDNEEVIKQLKKLITTISSIANVKIYIHIILRQKDSKNYDLIIDGIKKIDEFITLLPNVKIGTITGERNINSEAYYNVIGKENGEKWPDYNRKLRFSETQNVIPIDVDPFYMHSGFKLERNDVAFFMNYEDVDCDGFISKITNVKLYTLFPMKSYSYAINVYNELEPRTYFSKVLEENNLNCLILTTEDRISSINYNLCGLKEYKSPNIVYENIKDRNTNIKSVLDENYNYIIFDYDLVNFKEIRKIKEFLMIIDEQINEIYNISETQDYHFYISSLYGIYKKFIVGIDKEVFLDYSLEVPAIIIDRNISKSKFMFKYGTTHDLSNTIFNLQTKNNQIPNSIRKRGILSYFQD